MSTSEAKFPKNAVPVPNPKFEVFGGFVPDIPQNIGLSPPRRFPNFPHLSTYFLVPIIRGKSRNPHYSPKTTLSKKRSYFKHFLAIFWKLMTIFRYILQFLLLKIDKRDVWDSKRPLRMKWQLSDFGEKWGFPNFPQNHCPCPHLKLWGFLGNLSLKIPKSLVLPIPEFSPKNLKTLSPSPPCPQISGTGKGIYGEWGHNWPH